MYFATAAFSFLLFHFAYYNCIVCIPHFCRGGVREGEFERPTKREKEGGGTWQDLNIQRGVAGKEQCDFF